MKLKIKIKLKEGQVMPRIIKKGDWIDLYSNEEVKLNAGEFKLVDLGVAMELPKGFEAIVISRSSSFKNFGFIQTNSIGVIDNSYCGNEDWWKDPILSILGTYIKVGDRICQFRIQLSQKATFWQKLKWLFSSEIELEQVDNLTSSNRGGFGSTGKN